MTPEIGSGASERNRNLHTSEKVRKSQVIRIGRPSSRQGMLDLLHQDEAQPITLDEVMQEFAQANFAEPNEAKISYKALQRAVRSMIYDRGLCHP